MPSFVVQTACQAHRVGWWGRRSEVPSDRVPTGGVQLDKTIVQLDDGLVQLDEAPAPGETGMAPRRWPAHVHGTPSVS